VEYRKEKQRETSKETRLDFYFRMRKQLAAAGIELVTPKVDFVGTDLHPQRLPLHLRCQKGHNFWIAWFNLSQNGDYCRKCTVSRPQLAIQEWITSNLIPDSEIRANAKYVIPGVNEIDIWIPSLKLAIEYNGLYFHSDGMQRSNRRHLEKRELLERQGITLLQINADEWSFRTEIVKSLLRIKMGKALLRYAARDLEYRKVPKEEANSFLEKNHLMGALQAVSHHGLWTSEGRLVCLLSLKQHTQGVEISRFCSELNAVVNGGMSKLLSHSTLPTDRLLSFVDLRYATGSSLKRLGFKLQRITLGWKWTDYVRTYNRLKCRANMDERGLTESQHAAELKLCRIYDAGQALFVRGPNAVPG
jgi:hypothetical protein